MDKFDRIFQLHQILSSRRTRISVADLQEKLGCSRSSVYRLLDVLEDCLHAPVIKDADGIRYDPAARGTYELPGLWFNPQELEALVTLQKLVECLDPGLLQEHMRPLKRRLQKLLAHRHLNLDQMAGRVRILSMIARRPGEHFQSLAAAALRRRKINVTYHSRSKDRVTVRTLSPQRIVHYRDAWYLDAWDHACNALRTFSTDKVEHCKELLETAMDISDHDLDAHFASAYGIFSGAANQLAVLVFSAERARWVADETWHPEQKGGLRADGRYELQIPYREDRELLMDILRHGGHVEVIAPEQLRQAVISELGRAAAIYERS